MTDLQFQALCELMSKGGCRTKPMKRALRRVFVDGIDIDTAAAEEAQFPSALHTNVRRARRVMHLTYKLVTGLEPCKANQTP